MERGWIKLWRKLEDSGIFSDPYLLQLFLWCLMRANYKARSVSVRTGTGNTLVPLQPGQFIFGRKSAGKALRQPPMSVRDRMAKLERHGNLVIKPVTHYSIITILNWDTYQGADEGVPSPNPSPSRHPAVTDKKGKKGKNNPSSTSTSKKQEGAAFDSGPSLPRSTPRSTSGEELKWIP